MSQPAETTRRTLNVMEAMIIAALLGLAGLIFRLNDSVTQLKVTQEYTNSTLMDLRAQLADVPALSQRVTRLEIRQDSNAEAIKELRGVKGLK